MSEDNSVRSFLSLHLYMCSRYWSQVAKFAQQAPLPTEPSSHWLYLCFFTSLLNSSKGEEEEEKEEAAADRHNGLCFNSSILEAQTVQGQPWSHIQFQASMSYILISCFKSKKSKWTKALKNKCLKPGVMCNNLGPVIPAPQEESTQRMWGQSELQNETISKPKHPMEQTKTKQILTKDTNV